MAGALGAPPLGTLREDAERALNLVHGARGGEFSRGRVPLEHANAAGALGRRGDPLPARQGGGRRSRLWVIEGWWVVEHGGERRVVRGTCGEESDV